MELFSLAITNWRQTVSEFIEIIAFSIRPSRGGHDL
jgi:hypothetical protein